MAGSGSDFLGGLFGDGPMDPGGILNDALKKARQKKQLPCGDKHQVGSNGVCHKCGEKVSKPAPKPKRQIRRKVVEGTSYIHADDVAQLLEDNKVEPGIVKMLRALKET